MSVKDVLINIILLKFSIWKKYLTSIDLQRSIAIILMMYSQLYLKVKFIRSKNQRCSIVNVLFKENI